MARTKKELKDQDPLLGNETVDQTAGADGTGLTPGGEPGAPTPSDLELADGTPLDPDAPQTETGQEPISVKIIMTTEEKYGILAAWKS